jgi:ribosomal protein L29
MASELKDKTEKEMQKMLSEAREAVRKFRFSMSGANKKNVKEVRLMKKKIAQILTEIHAREMLTNNK